MFHENWGVLLLFAIVLFCFVLLACFLKPLLRTEILFSHLDKEAKMDESEELPLSVKTRDPKMLTPAPLIHICDCVQTGAGPEMS